MKRLLLVSGPPRSGTTLMMQVLNMHPRIALFYECNLLHILFSLNELFWKERKDSVKERWLTPRETYTIENLEAQIPKKDLSWELLIEALWRPIFPDKWWEKGDIIIGDKWNLPHMQPKFLHYFKNHGIMLLWVTRNPADTAASWVVKEINEGLRNIRREDLIFEALGNWAMTESFAAFAKQAGIKMLRVQYENFCQNPMSEIVRICRWLGIRTTETTKGIETNFFSDVPAIVDRNTKQQTDLKKSERREIMDLMNNLRFV